MIEGFIAGATAAVIGVISSHGVSVAVRQRGNAKRISTLEAAIPELITRAEVQNAFSEMARIEGARMAQQQQQQQQQVRAESVFGTSQAVQRAEGLNAQVNDQLAALNERINALNS
mgnify:CR=1 FL=1